MKHMFGTYFKPSDELQVILCTNVVWWIPEQPDSRLKFRAIVAVYNKHCCTDFVKPDEGSHRIEKSLTFYCCIAILKFLE